MANDKNAFSKLNNWGANIHIFVLTYLKGDLQSVCKQSLCLHFCVQNIELYSTTIYIFKLLEYNKLSRNNNQAFQELET